MTDRPNIQRFAGAAAVALLVSGAAPVASAAATSSELTDGSLDWGVKESFRSYIVSPAADGEIEVNGASENSDGSFSFGNGAGTLGDGTADLAFTGSVHFTGHDGALDVTISNLGVQIDGSSGSLIADVSSLGQDGEPAEFPDMVLADLDLSGASLEADTDGVVSVSDVPATLSDAGAPALGGSYEAGEALDPVSFTVQTSGGGATDDTAEDSAGAADDEDALPKTGAPWLLLAVGGLVLVAVSAAFVLFGRRRVTGGARR